MSQSKRHSAIESITNTTVGILMSFGVQLVLYPIMKIPVTIGENLIITAVFFVVSVIRMYVLRRFFNKNSG